MFTPDEDIYSYFVKHDALTNVVACPGIKFTSLANSCYVPTEEIFGTALEDDDDTTTIDEKLNCPNCGSQLVKKIGSPKYKTR